MAARKSLAVVTAPCCAAGIEKVDDGVTDDACEQSTGNEYGCKDQKLSPPASGARCLALWARHTWCRRCLVNTGHTRRALGERSLFSGPIHSCEFLVGKPLPGFFTGALLSLHAVSSSWNGEKRVFKECALAV